MIKKAICFILLSLVLFTACSNSSKLKSTSNSIPQYKTIPFKYFYEGFVLQENSDLPNGNELNPEIKNVISDNPDKYTNNMRCTNEDIKTITEYAKIFGIENPYIPIRGYATDYIIDIRKEKDDLIIVYPHFSVTESSKDIPPRDKAEQEKDVDLDIGPAKWRVVDGHPVQLYLKLKNVYVTIDSAKFSDETQYISIANSLVQIKYGLQ